MYPADFRGRATPLAHADLEAEAAALACTVAIVHAFSDIESAGSGFLKDGRPKILFEAKVFHNRSNGEYDAEAPDLSSPGWDRSLYGAAGGHQYDRLARAMQLSPRAALEATSWGRYQVMGFNFHMVGFDQVEQLVEAFCESEGAQLQAFGAYCQAANLTDAMREDPPDFVRLALGYNGPGERANGYDEKLAAAFYHYQVLGEAVIPQLSPMAELSRSEVPGMVPVPDDEGPRVLCVGMVGRDVQLLQAALGLKQDRIFGRKTRAALIAFQRDEGLDADGFAGAETKARLGLS